MYAAWQLRQISVHDSCEQIPGYEAATPGDRRHLRQCVHAFLADTYGPEPQGNH